jgi:tRNA threonylcarbamoyladenosine biosynthesis protein TsaE
VSTLVAVTRTPDATLALATRVGALLRGGDVLALTGDLGAGKTLFAKGVGRALGVTEPVVSPTFTVVREYEGTIRFVHVDVYRLDRIQELHDVGWDDLLDDESVALVEWGERVSALLPIDRLDVRLEIGDDGDEHRVLEFVASGMSWASRADALEAALRDDRTGV